MAVDIDIEEAIRTQLLSYEHLLELLTPIDLGNGETDYPIRPDGLDEHDEKPGIAIQVRDEVFAGTIDPSSFVKATVVFRVMALSRKEARAIARQLQHNGGKNLGLGAINVRAQVMIGPFWLQSATPRNRKNYVVAGRDASDQFVYVSDCTYELAYIDQVNTA